MRKHRKRKTIRQKIKRYPYLRYAKELRGLEREKLEQPNSEKKDIKKTVPTVDSDPGILSGSGSRRGSGIFI